MINRIHWTLGTRATSLLAIVLVLFSSFIGNHTALAQKTKEKMWSIQVSSGASFPVGKFSEIDVSKTISVRDEGTVHAKYKWEGFDKQSNGSAKTGYFLSGFLERLISSNVLLSAGYLASAHNVKTSPVNDYYDDKLNSDFPDSPPFTNIFIQTNYHLRAGLLRIGYLRKLAKIDITLRAGVGYAELRYPDYTWTAYNGPVAIAQGSPEIGLVFAQNETPDDPRSPVFLMNGEIKYHITRTLFLGADASFFSANFDYSIDLRSPGRDPNIRNDTVNYRVLNLGLLIGLSL